jgi:hypothetical protein
MRKFQRKNICSIKDMDLVIKIESDNSNYQIDKLKIS